MRKSKLFKIVLFLTYCMFCFTLPFFIQAAIRHACPLCQTIFFDGHPYLWDIQSGAVFPLYQYSHAQSNVFWLDSVNHLGQERSSTCATARFPGHPRHSPIYCSAHRPSDRLNRFLILTVHPGYTITYPVPSRGHVPAADCFVSQHYDADRDEYELLVTW